MCGNHEYHFNVTQLVMEVKNSSEKNHKTFDRPIMLISRFQKETVLTDDVNIGNMLTLFFRYSL